jgi:hypothetical protein
MDIQTSPDLFARARELGVEIVAAADEIERTRRIPRRCWSDCMPRGCSACCCRGLRAATMRSLRFTWLKSSPGTTPRLRGMYSSPTGPA